MSDAPHDQNFVKAKMGVLCTDGITPIPIAINPLTGEMMVDEVSVISYNPEDIAPRDNNHQPVWLGESTVDGKAIPLNVNAQGAVLVDT